MSNQPVLVTGADTGIGRQTVETLAKNGHRIYAGAYLQSSIDELNKLENVKAHQLDVTKQDSIDKLAEWISSQGDGLYGVVNNAGVADNWPTMEMTEAEFHRVVNINLYGVFRVTNTLMPMLIESKGRVVTMGSLSGTIPTKFIGPYSVSKFGVEALMDIYYFEMRPFGLHFATVKPGNVKSNITKQMVPIFEKRKDRIATSHFRNELEMLQKGLKNEDVLERVEYEPPTRVVAAIEHALYSDTPKTKYFVTTYEDNKAGLGWMLRVIAQLNQGHTYPVSREDLHAMLDKQLDKFA